MIQKAHKLLLQSHHFFTILFNDKQYIQAQAAVATNELRKLFEIQNVKHFYNK